MPANEITFVIPGYRVDAIDAAATRGGPAGPEAAPPLGLPGRLKASVQVGQRRGAGDEQRVVAVPGRDMVVVHIAGGPSLVLHPENARDLMLAQSDAKRQAGQPLPSDVDVPAQLRWRGLEAATPASRGATRGFLGDVLLKAVEVVTGPPLEDTLQDFVASKVVKGVDGQVVEGVYALGAESLVKLKASGQKPVQVMTGADQGPTLVLVHGTFSSTSGTFAKLWQHHPQRVRTLFNAYGGRVFALDHATLGKSPIENAWTLAQACEPGTRLHLLTHSRGGLVAEVLVRAAGLAARGGQVDDAAKKLFAADNLRGQLATLVKLVKLMKDNRISVERMVRVACPARGTLLASKRFDAYLSVLKWGLELAQLQVLPELVDFLAGVAQRRADPALLPGLAAMIPDSPLVSWLHAGEEPAAGELRVIAGDLEGDSIGSWLKTLAADAFYWTDNDLVVQTRSMYGGVPRTSGASFLLDQGGQVSHFNYFTNERTAEGVVAGLTQGRPAGWQPIGPLSYAGESSAGVRGAPVPTGTPSAMPAVFVLPGILGSNLKVDGKRIWLGVRLVNGLSLLEYPDDGRTVEPDGAVGLTYDSLIEHLSQANEVIEFSYDWRKPLEQEARRLADAVEAALTAREQSGQPVRIVAHSMGGLLARTMLLECKPAWDRMMANSGARLLMLGTPNGGSWAPMQCLSGDDTFGNALVAFGAPFQDHKARQMMAQFPGFIQLQAALVNDPRALDKSATWKALADDDIKRVREHNYWHQEERQLEAYTWGVPAQGVLDAAVGLRKRLDQQRDNDLANYPGKILLVVGQANFTPDGYEVGEEGLVYLNAQQAGDGRVTLASAMLPGVPTWKLDSEHGSLPGQKEAFTAFDELLQQGSTTRLMRQPETTATRGAAAVPVAHVRSRPARERKQPRPPQPAESINLLELAPPALSSAARSQALAVTVINADLAFIRQPLMLGHYLSDNITGTERVANALIGGTMAESLAMGQYPDNPGTHQLFANIGAPNRENPLQTPRPESVLIVGLGEEGKLKADQLVYTIKLGVLALAQRLVEQPAGPPLQFELAATLIGSGGAGMDAGQSAQLIARGVRAADAALRERNERTADAGRRWPVVGQLWLVELYLDRAGEAWRALHQQSLAEPNQYRLADAVRSGQGALRRPLDGGYRGADYDYIRAITVEGREGKGIEYTLDTKRARAEVRAQATQSRLVEDLVANSSNEVSKDPRVGRTLFQLLVPVEIGPNLGASTEMLIELDPGTAGIPWEMLDTSDGVQGNVSSDPWAIRTKLVRKLRLKDFRQQTIDAGTSAHVLVIGEPDCEARYPRLYGAREEAKTVRDLLCAVQALGAESVLSLISPDDDGGPRPQARDVINALMQRNWRIVHIAGHGELPEKVPAGCNREGDPRGVVLSNGTFLGPREIRSMRVVPELVFVNCCHLGARDIGQLLTTDASLNYDRPRFASGVAEELIKIGVRCVVAAGWAVDDAAATAFASTFYESLLRGVRFMDAAADARKAAHALGGNTWAAYQCYGDPDWVFRREGADAQRPARSLGDEFASVTSPLSLALALETLAIGSRFQGRKPEDQRAKIRHLEARFSGTWGSMGAVAEAFAVAWDAAKDRESAIRWYAKAVAANDGSASLKAQEQLANLKVRQAWSLVDDAKTQAAIAEAAGQAHAMIDEAVVLLRRLADMQATPERENLLGSAFKRRAMVRRKQRDDTGALAEIDEMERHYARAEQIIREGGMTGAFYPAMNRLAAVCARAAGKSTVLDPALVNATRQELLELSRDDPDFWKVASMAELRLYEALAAGELGKKVAGIIEEFNDLNSRMPGTQNWDSVLDNLNFVLYGVLKEAAAESLMVAIKKYLGRG